MNKYGTDNPHSLSTMKTGHGLESRYGLSRGGPPEDLFSVSFEHSDRSPEHYKELVKTASPVRNKGRTPEYLVRPTILKICADDYVQLRTLVDLSQRESNSSRNHYVNPIIAEGLLELRYPHQPNHPLQAYRMVGRAAKENL